jgi:hypothetical protein
MTLDDLQGQVFQLNAPPGTVWDPTTAIAKKYLVDKVGTQLRGTPISAEITLDDGSVAQVFQSGQIALYHGDQDPQVTVV